MPHEIRRASRSPFLLGAAVHVVARPLVGSGQRKVETQKRAFVLVFGVSRGWCPLPLTFRAKEGSIGGGRGGQLKVETPKTSAHLWGFKGSARNGGQLVDRKTNVKCRRTPHTSPLSLSLPLPSLRVRSFHGYVGCSSSHGCELEYELVME